MIRGNDKVTDSGWTALQELIVRGDKHKALALYRLLSSSADDRAYVLHVEGDILWAFDDKHALEKYEEAAYLYDQEQRFAEAFFVYKTLYKLERRDNEILLFLVKLAAFLKEYDTFDHYCSFVIEKLISHEILVKDCEEMFLTLFHNDMYIKERVQTLAHEAGCELLNDLLT